jgi:hypothetical protein
MRKINLKVTSLNIKNGKITDPANCPIANAIKREFKGLLFVSVLADRAFVGIKKGVKKITYCSPLSKEATTFVKNYDRGNFVKPFKFELMLSKASVK